ncbi:MAG: allantoinase AllB [Terrimicrobiaceae bacterium]|nr:allantoinase AllB [Terrimicrobiaceae bacterium]
MSGVDRIVRGGSVLTPEGFAACDVRVCDGEIAEVGASLRSGGAVEEIDATGMLVLPGVFDAHVHFNEPGREHWEGFATGSHALALGGGTAFADMPLNAAPPTIDRDSFERKRAAGEAASVLDFALWGGLIPQNLDRLEELAACGVIGFKAFMIDSGTADFPGVDARVLRAGMQIAARLGLPVAVHAEDSEIIGRRTAEMRAAGRSDARAFLDSRPVEAEVEAVRVALDLAGETGCALHVVHLSSPAAVARVVAAREGGLDVTCEVCPHHLLLDERAMFQHGAMAKCAPPLRDAATRDALWRDALDGRIDCIGSDHSPAPPGMKRGDDLFAAWGGIMGCQHGFLLLLDACGDALSAVWNMLSSRPAARFGFGDRKGRIAPGCDADLVLIERTEERPIRAEELRYRHRTSPYVGRQIASRVARSLLRGTDVPFDREGLQPGGGRFLSRSA